MAPHSSYKKHVKFAKSRSPIPRRKVKHSADSYANIVLHYLSKLKGLFQSPRVHGIEPRRTESFDNISKPILKKEAKGKEGGESKRKAYEIVNAALQYGCANNVIEKMGNYFLVKSKSDQRVATRRPTPGPDYIRCASCKKLSKYPSRSRSRSKDRLSSRYRRKRYYDEDCSHRRSISNTSIVNYCPKCYARLKPRRRL